MAAQMTYWDTVRVPYQMEERESRNQVAKLLEGTVLDVGCGTGPFYPLFKIGYKGVDYCEQFIDTAQDLFPDGDFEVQDATKLKEKDKSWDNVLFYQSLEHIGDWKQAIKEAKRVAKKHICIVLWKPFVGETVTNRSKFYTDSDYRDTYLHQFNREDLENEFKTEIIKAEKMEAEGYNFLYLLKV